MQPAKSPLEKLRADTRRFQADHGLTSWGGMVKLSLIIDYWAVLHFRLCEYCSKSRSLLHLPLKLVLALTKPVVEGLSASRLRMGAEIGGGLLLHHSMGVAIACGATIGENCTIFSGVLVAHRADGSGRGAPRIGDNVHLMSGCKILGNVEIGDGAVIGANAVVLANVPAGAVAVGIPARVVVKER